MNSQDPKGYYAILGVSPSASVSDIKVAFRRRAMELHPDRNKSSRATRDFQHLNTAYSVLSDPNARAQYDTLDVEARTKSEMGQHAKRPEPIVCSMCGSISAQPRYAIFYEVKSFIFATMRTPIQGVFCRACAEKRSLKASVVTWLLGWWGVPWGPLYSVQAIVVNLLGGKRPHIVNARVAAYQAWFFAANGKVDLARAIALDALSIAKKIQPIWALDKRRKALGYEGDNEGARVSQQIDDLCVELNAGVQGIRLKNSWALIGRALILHLLMMLTAAGLVMGALNLDLASQRPSSSPTGEWSLSDDPPVTSNYQRSEFADNGAPWPQGSGYVSGYPRRLTDGHSTITIDNTKNDSDVFVKLYSLGASPPAPARVVLVRAFEQFTVRRVRAGLYDVRHRDLDTGALLRSESFELKEARMAEGIRFSRFTLTLYKVTDGNMESYPLSEEEF